MRAAMHRDRQPQRQWSYASRLATHSTTTSVQRERWARANAAVALLLLLAALSLMAITLWTDVDLWLADRTFNAGAGIFPLRDAWITATFNHVILKRALTALALLILIAVSWDLCSPLPWSWLRRFQLRIVAFSALLVPTTISLLKQVSNSHCPWDLQRYGGSEPYIKLFELMPPGVSAGHCMPAGHASSALWMISLSVLFIPHRLLHASIVLMLLLVLGVGVGWLQQLRGAHFLTHTLWSAWIALFIVFLVTTCLDRWPRRQL
ncbi:phosphatase PAP2 family protein [Massilia soli]|nr:phosphatase PAP2 family protein [Massilia soli]